MFQKLESDLTKLDPDKKNILLQCSSLGEFHEAKPVIAELDRFGSYNFIISFFSPSGYDNFLPAETSVQASDNVKQDFIINSNIIKTLLPFDWYWNVKRFITLLDPSAVLLIKYDLWYNFLYYLAQQNIYSALINAKYKEGDIKWKFIFKSFYRTMFNFLNAVITAGTDSERAYKKILSNDVAVINYGDTKIEYISRSADTERERKIIDEEILKNRTVLVAGSTWQEDEDLILPVIDKICSKSKDNGLSLLAIIAPHEPAKPRLEEIEKKIDTKYKNINAIRFSHLKNYQRQNVILIDSIGLLFSIYKYAALAYVGGGFRTGMHNVLEPASYGIPVLFGNVKISEDAEQLLKTGSGIAVNNGEELYIRLTELLKEKDKREELGSKSIPVFENGSEPSKKIAELITEI